MNRSHLILGLATAILAVTTSSIASAAPPRPGSGSSPGPARGAACEDPRENQTLEVNVRQHHEDFAYDKSMVPSRDLWHTTRTYQVGRLHIVATTCRDGRVLTPVVTTTSAGLDREGNLKGGEFERGWGVGIRGGGTSTSARPYFDATAMGCSQARLFSVLTKGAPLLGKIPIPQAKYIGTAASLAVKYLPKDKIRCRELATYRIELAADQGRLVGGVETLSFHPVETESSVPNPQQPNTVVVFRLTTEANVG